MSSIHEEIRKISDWYFLDSEKETVAVLAKSFSDYLELTFQPDQVEIITGGRGDQCAESFSKISQELGLSSDSLGFFKTASRAFPDAFLGIKVPFLRNGGISVPSLYVRSKCPKSLVFAYFSEIGTPPEILDQLKILLVENEFFYGLGFTGSKNGALVKSYTIGPIGNESDQLGFVSHRIDQSAIQSVYKEYVPDLPIEEFVPPDESWAPLLNFLRNSLKYETAGHLGYEISQGKRSQPKIYVEKIGAIPTDFQAV